MHLLADVGGTNVRFAVADAVGALRDIVVVPTQDDFAALVDAYLRDIDRPSIDCFACAAAGPCDGDAITLTNRPLRIDPALLVASSGARRALLVNDFAAVGHAVPLLQPSDVEQCGGGTRCDEAPALLIGPGTGLGVACALWSHGDWQVLPGEAGHADLAAVDDAELRAWQALRRGHGRVSAEDVLSGPGLQRLHLALGGEPGLTPLQIDRAADAGDAVAVECRRLFVGWLGRVAGNLALALDARGGVFIAGGIVPGWRQRFDHARFREGFEDKAPMVARMRAIPSFVVIHPVPALLGLARLAISGCGAVR